MIIYRWWHGLLDMPKQSKAWHKEDVADELAEYKEAKGILHNWSELSDVVYTITRARWSGYNLKFPLGFWHFVVGSLYMFPKYSMRWLFFSRAGRKAGSKAKIREVRNPGKVEKLEVIASQYGISPDKFVKICKKQLRYWPLLK